MPEVSLDNREHCIANNIDPSGRKWTIKTIRGSHMFCTRPEPDRADAVIPPNCAGKWTSSHLLKEQVERYVKLAWDNAETVATKNRRKDHKANQDAGK